MKTRWRFLFLCLGMILSVQLLFKTTKQRKTNVRIQVFPPNDHINYKKYIKNIENFTSSSSKEVSYINLQPLIIEKKVNKKQSDSTEEDTSDIQTITSVKNLSPGQMGNPVHINNKDPFIQKQISSGWQLHAFNQYVSDLISVNRSLPDARDEWCKEPHRNPSNLPSTDIIICFHNEAASTLHRTVHSVINRSPPHLINKILLVDDASTLPHLHSTLDTYMEAFPQVTIIRSPSRVGLIRARLLGAQHATAQVLTFLDSHCECNQGWLEPLLGRIAENSTRVVCPVIDAIDATTMEYHHKGADKVHVGGFNWNLLFNWHKAPKRERQKHSHPAEPLHSPTMAGGLFSISRSYFYKLGAYDPGFDIWGGENLELSFKIWMCGGSLEIVPCSHVGHIFRKRSPYTWRKGVNVLKRNFVRLAEVWMDEYKQFYYDRIGHVLGDYGNVEDRKILRRQLECKPFSWYLSSIYPELFIPSSGVASGKVTHSRTSKCLTAPLGKKKDVLYKEVVAKQCVRHRNKWNVQHWDWTAAGEIRRDEACLDYAGGKVIMYPCHGQAGNQVWQLRHAEDGGPDEDGWRSIVHEFTGNCLGVGRDGKLVVGECVEGEYWKFQNYKPKETRPRV